jgi:DNA-binding MarR family transcriptional regulator
MSKQNTQRRQEKRPQAKPAARPHPTRSEEAAPLELDRIVHERLRLGILTALAVNESLSFNELKQTLNTTDGNLSVHARKLEEAGYIVCNKSFDGRMPRTDFHLSSSGRRALERYLDEMEGLISKTRTRTR